MTAIQGLGELCKHTPSYIARVADVLAQLLMAGEGREGRRTPSPLSCPFLLSCPLCLFSGALLVWGASDELPYACVLFTALPHVHVVMG